MTEVTAVITKVDLDYVDHRGYALGLSFLMDGGHATTFLFFQDLKQIGEMMRDSKSAHIEDLNGKVVTLDLTNDTYKFRKMWKI